MNLSLPAFLLFATTALAAQSRSEAPSWSAEPDGSLWVAGSDYKAHFDARGVEFVPFLGSSAPRNFPVRFELVSVRAGAALLSFSAEGVPQRDGDRVRIDRGCVREVYDARAGSLEQSFVVEADCTDGLVLRLAVESELERASDAQGLLFSSERGGVRLSAAFAIDSEGTRVEVPLRWTDGALLLEVPRGLRGPVTVDPVLATWSTDTTTFDDLAPDLAWSDAGHLQCVVWERIFSALDHDVYYRFLDMNGVPTGPAGYIDSSSNNVTHPRVAHNAYIGNFLCVAASGGVGGAPVTVIGRTISAAGTLGTTFTIDASAGADHDRPVVGGDSTTLPPTFYFVAYEDTQTSGHHRIMGRLVYNNGTLPGPGPMIVADLPNNNCRMPEISKTDGGPPAGTQAWTIVWMTEMGFLSYDVSGAQISWDGNLVLTPYVITQGAATDFYPHVSSLTDAAPRRYLVSFVRPNTGNGADVMARLMEGMTGLDTQIVTDLCGGDSALDQLASSVDSDGRDFFVSWVEYVAGSSTDGDVKSTTIVQVGNTLAAAGGVDIEFASSALEEEPAVCALRSGTGTARRALIACRSDGGAPQLGNIRGALISSRPFTPFCTPGSGPTSACPCGNAPSGAQRGCDNSSGTGGGMLAGSGDPNLDSVVLAASNMRPSATCVFLQGATSNPAGVSFGDGVRCAAGQLLRLAVRTTSASSASSFPVSGDPSIQTRCQTLGAPIAFGQTRAYQVYYRDPASFGCASPATFNITAALQVQW